MFSDCHKIIFSVVPVQLIAMMITGLATRDLAVPTPLLANYPPCWLRALSYQLRRAGLLRRTGWRASRAAPAMISWPALRSAFDDQLPYCPLVRKQW